MTQPEALRLADEMEADGVCMSAAAELRRLYEDYENALKHFAEAIDSYKQMAAQRDELLEALKMLVLATNKVSIGDYNEEVHDIALSKARAAIAKAQQ